MSLQLREVSDHRGALPVVLGWFGIVAGMMVLPPLLGAMAGVVAGGALGFLLLFASLGKK